jgi:hypothetical protein
MICPECQQQELTNEKSHLSQYCGKCQASYWRYQGTTDLDKWERCYYRDHNGKSYILDIINHKILEISDLTGRLIIKLPYTSDHINFSNAQEKLKLYLTFQ